MTAALTFTSDLTTGFAVLLADRVDDLTWSDTADYAADDTGIWIASAPLDAGRSVTLTPYPLSAEPQRAQSMIGLQTISRSAGPDVRDAWTLDDAIQNALLGLFPIKLSTDIRVTSLAWTSGGSLGQDDQNHWMWTSNFAASVGRPSANRH